MRRDLAWFLVLATGCARAFEPRTGFDLTADVHEVPTLETLPSAYVGRWIEGDGQVVRVEGPHAFWVGSTSTQTLVVVRDRIPVDVRPGQWVRLRGIVLPGHQAAGLRATFDEPLRELARRQDRFLSVGGAAISTLDPEYGATRGGFPRPAGGRFDRNGDGIVTRTELADALAADPLWIRWDADRDRHLDPAELGALLFDAWDADADGAVSVAEWWAGTRGWYGRRAAGTFDQWDRDDDGRLDRGEIARGEEAWPLLARWDAGGDGRLSPEELATGLFDAWNLDGDEAISPLEAMTARAALPPGGLRALDADGDGTLTRDELRGAFDAGRVFAAWDADGDGRIDDGEIAAAWVEAGDRDGDGRLSAAEWDAVFDAWLPERRVGVFDDWDLDRDGRIARSELEGGLRVRGITRGWDADADGVLSADELREGLFTGWDLDRDGVLDGDEVAAF